MKTTEYVAGFLFTFDWKRVALIEKKRPEWQKGRLNAIGGHIEEQESPFDAMIREFVEESGMLVKYWRLFCVLSGYGYEHKGKWRVHFFMAHNTEQLSIKDGMTDEEVLWIDYQELSRHSIVPNLHWLIPMAISGSRGAFGNVWPFIIEEGNDVKTSLGANPSGSSPPARKSGTHQPEREPAPQESLHSTPPLDPQ